MTTPLLIAEGLRKTYARTTVLDGVDFSIDQGEKVCILGPSGSGKTTLLRCLNLLIQPTTGRLVFDGQLIGEWPRSSAKRVDVAKYRSRVAMVFQQFELFPHLTALENVTLGPRHVLGTQRRQAIERGLSLLERVGLRSFANAKPRTLSGGQQQRVAIARALAMDPAIILFDEPTSALDWEMVGEVLDIMARLAADGMTMVIVTHELDFARNCADRIVVMENGRVLEEGTTARMFGGATGRRAAEILGAVKRSASSPEASIG